MDTPPVRQTRSTRKPSANRVDDTERMGSAEPLAEVEKRGTLSRETETLIESVTVSEGKDQVSCIESNGTPRSANCSVEKVYLSPATRRQSIHGANTPDLLNFTGNDDEQERRQRRRSRVVDLQLDSPFRASPSQRHQEASATDIQKLTNAQLSDHYSTCIKLSTENKITTKNAFGLHLIDYMADILKQKDSELTNFKMAAGTLDASAKIYAVRVDAVHADVYKVLGGLDVPPQPSESVEAAPGEMTGTTDTEDIKKPQKRKKKESYKTIEQNLKNINRPDMKQKFEVDPMFEKAASFDECSASGVFLSYLHFYDNHCELLFDCAVKPLVICESLELPPLIGTDESDLKGILPSLDNRTICSSLTGFNFTHWDSEENEETAAVMLEKFRKSERVFDVNGEPEPDNNETCCAGISMVDDFDGDSYDNSQNLMRTGERRTAFAKDQAHCRRDVIPLEEADISTMCLQLSRKPGEYSYFSPRTMTMWRGPDHWRFKPHHKADSITDKAKKKKEKKIFVLDFSADVNFETYFKETRAATVLNKVTLDRRSKKATTLPADFHYDPENLMRFSLKPIYIVKRSPSKTIGADDDVLEDYNYNNPNDTTNFCPALQDADGDEDEQDMFDFGADQTTNLGETRITEMNGLNITTYGEENLIAEPQKVNKIVLNYAKTAKKMDMKRLKLTMWDLLRNMDNQVEKPGPTENGATEEATESPDGISKMVEMKAFSDVTRSLIPRLPKLMAENLSIPLAFACLLHLANEKNLKLSGVKDLCDVLIEQDS
ncbi:condensin complex subunit 2 [Protopterus annectens]|uniref:condensin complex subunit 2 n=1 Tax=Protopterus annectens TaxID=7888 RepID=UPI001CF9BC76|nr:condensin complex subunit 2 [Protopterus annectens]